MTNSNLADISAFESIQSEQHHRTNVSSMSVFNSPDDVQQMQKAADDFIPVLDKMLVAQEAFQKAKQIFEAKDKEWKDAANLGDDATKTYDKIVKDITESIQKQELDIIQMDKEKRKAAESAIIKEKKAIDDIQNKVKQN